MNRLLLHKEGRDLRQFFYEGREIALVGAGPSLLFWKNEISRLKEKALFLVADIVARGFVRAFGAAHKMLVFSVESKRHSYLISLPKHIPIAFYARGNLRNLPRYNPVYFFALMAEDQPFLKLPSPGTVMGLALAYALYLLRGYGGVLHFFGMDLAFLDGMVYAPMVYSFGGGCSRLHPYEQQELVRSYQRGTSFIKERNFVIRTSAEFLQARQNILQLLKTVNFPLEILNYSPVSLPLPQVTQMIPEFS
ncbi:MAG: hypothetical protein NZM25_06810 [Leptospiraceae bacterium]|nr:hypothetical protein [Leptospiraceae bacterium]MDW8306855.1 hypothetical protein [Leptospiraceae bacterium]